METKTIRDQWSDHGDIHGSEGRLRAAWQLATRDLPTEDLSLVGRFIDSCRAEGLSASRCTMYLYKLRRIREFLGKGFSEANRSDVERVVAEIYGQGYKPWTVHLYKVALKKFYRWLRGAERDPPEVTWIKVSLKDNEKILPEDILTSEEIKRMVKVAHSLRDKTYVETGYEGGFRPGEMLTLRIRSVEFDHYGAVITVRGKTGSRRVRTVESSPRLQTWMENHPHRDNPDGWLWVNIGNTTHRSTSSPLPLLSQLVQEVSEGVVGYVRKARVAPGPHVFRSPLGQTHIYGDRDVPPPLPLLPIPFLLHLGHIRYTCNMHNG